MIIVSATLLTGDPAVITLVMDAPFDTSHAEALTTDFTVVGDTVTSFNYPNDHTVELSLANGYAPGDTADLSYTPQTPPAGYASAGDAYLAAFSHMIVEQSSTTGSLQLINATVDPGFPNVVTLTFNLDIDATHVEPAPSAFTLPGYTVTSFTHVGTTQLQLGLNNDMVAGEVATVSYVAPAAPKGFAAANNGYLASFTNMPVVNNLVPASTVEGSPLTILSAIVDPDAPNAISITVDAPLDPSHLEPLFTSWTIAGHNVTSYNYDNTATIIGLATDALFNGGEVITLGYNRPTRPRGYAAAGNRYLPTFTGLAVKNNLPYTPPGPPMEVISVYIDQNNLLFIALQMNVDFDPVHAEPPVTSWTIPGRTVTGYNYGGSDVVHLLVDVPFGRTESSSVSYARPAGAGFAGAGNGYLASFDNLTVPDSTQPIKVLPPPFRPIPQPWPLALAKPVPSWVPTNTVSMATYGGSPTATPAQNISAFTQCCDAIRPTGGVILFPPGVYDLGLYTGGLGGFLLPAPTLTNVCIYGYGAVIICDTQNIEYGNMLDFLNPNNVVVMGLTGYDRGFDGRIDWKGCAFVDVYTTLPSSNFQMIDCASDHCVAFFKAVSATDYLLTNCDIQGKATHTYYGIDCNYTAMYSKVNLVCDTVKRGFIAYGGKNWDVTLSLTNDGTRGYSSNGFVDPIAFTDLPSENINFHITVSGSLAMYSCLMQYYHQADGASYYRNVNCEINATNISGNTALFKLDHATSAGVQPTTIRTFENCDLTGSITGTFDGLVVVNPSVSTGTTNNVRISNAFLGYQDFSLLPSYFHMFTPVLTLLRKFRSFLTF